MNVQTNLLRIKAVAEVLKTLDESFVFVGGATVALYGGTAAPEARPTDDVDVVIELASYSGYAELEERLRVIGFSNDVSSKVICRYTYQGIIVDIMPTNPEIIGFSNIWYPQGFKEAKSVTIENGTEIQIFTIPYFLASKWEAFKSRGALDFRGSSDFEDIVYVLENAENIEEELINSPPQVKSYLKQEFGEWLDGYEFEEGLYCHVERGSSSDRVPDIIAMLRKIFMS